MWRYHYYNDGFMGCGGLDSIFTVLWLVLVVAIVVMLVKRCKKGGCHVTNFLEKSPVDTLKERYAKGEIDREEFEQKKKDLS